MPFAIALGVIASGPWLRASARDDARIPVKDSESDPPHLPFSVGHSLAICVVWQTLDRPSPKHRRGLQSLNGRVSTSPRPLREPPAAMGSRLAQQANECHASGRSWDKTASLWV